MIPESSKGEKVCIFRLDAASKEDEAKYGLKSFYFVGDLESQYLVAPVGRSRTFDTEFSNPIVAIRNSRSLEDLHLEFHRFFQTADLLRTAK